MTKKIRIFEILWFLYLAILVMASYIIQEGEDTMTPFEKVKLSTNEDNNNTAFSDTFTMFEEEESGTYYCSYDMNNRLVSKRKVHFPSVYEGHTIRKAGISVSHPGHNGEEPILYIEEIRYDEGIEEIEDTDDTNLCISLKAVSIPRSMKKIPDGIFDRSKKSVVLTVYPGSFGERYAKKNGYQYQYKEEQNDSVDKH